MDKPMMQFKLSIPDSDAMRSMIERDYRRTLDDAALLQTPEQRKAAPEGAYSDVQRRMTHGERLAEIFSVNLPKR